MQTSPDTITNEMTVMRIPISQLRENPNNPRKAVKPESVAACAESMKAVGQETPIKVRKVRPQSTDYSSQSNQQPEIATSQTEPIGSAPRNDSLTAEASAQSVDSYELVGGHIRLAAAKSLGWDWLNAIVLEMNDDQAEVAALLDNQGEDMTWLDWDFAIEGILQKNPNVIKENLANQLGLDPAEISRAVVITKALNDNARKILLENFKQSTESYQLPRSAALRLALLNYNNPEDLVNIEKSLKVALEGQMTEPQVAQLVRWVQSGKDPASFPRGASNPSPAASRPSQIDSTDPYGSIWQTLPANAKVIRGKSGYELRLKLAPSEAPTAVYSALAAIEHLKETSLLPGAPQADPRYAKALPDFASEGRRLKAIEQGMEAAHLEHQKQTKEGLKSQKAQAARAEKETQKRVELENFKADTQNRLRAIFGQGVLTDSLWKMVQEGRGGEALKLAKTVLGQSGKTAEEQEAIATDLKLRFKRLARQKPTPKAELATDGEGSNGMAIDKAKAELATDEHLPSLKLGEAGGLTGMAKSEDKTEALAANQGELAQITEGKNPKDSLATDGQGFTGMEKDREKAPVRAEESPMSMEEQQPIPVLAKAEDKSASENPEQSPSLGLFDQVKQAVAKQVGSIDSGSLAQTATDMLLKDAKQAVNYTIRKGMRNILKDAL